eukprot:1054410-Prorocentrum_minimum.AAC.2
MSAKAPAKPQLVASVPGGSNPGGRSRPKHTANFRIRRGFATHTREADSQDADALREKCFLSFVGFDHTAANLDDDVRKISKDALYAVTRATVSLSLHICPAYPISGCPTNPRTDTYTVSNCSPKQVSSVQISVTSFRAGAETCPKWRPGGLGKRSSGCSLPRAWLDKTTIREAFGKLYCTAPPIGISIWERPGFCPWLVIASVYHATPFVYVWNSELGP